MTDTVLDAARAYLADGWSPIPLPAGKKWPPPNGVTGWRGRYTTTADLSRPGWDWSGNIGIRLPADVAGIDIDVYHGGDRSLTELEGRLGELPPTRWSTSRDDGSGIALFRVPIGTTLRTDPAEGIDVIQFHHRYAVCAPSVHPDTGRPYRWIDEQADEEVDGPGEIGELPELPWAWIAELIAIDKTGAANAVTPEQADTFLERHAATGRPAALKGLRTQLIGVKPGGRHDALVTTACWAMREAAAGLYTAAEAVDVLHTWWIGAVADDPRRREGGEFGAAILWAIGQAEAEPGRVARIHDEHAPVDLTDLIAPTNGHIDPATGEILTARLDDAFWTARPVLVHIRDAARNRLVAPAAVLGAVLARVAAFTPPSTCLPPLVGSTAPLSIYIALRGNSGAGKSSPTATAADMLPTTPPGCVGPLALGSGEGLVEAYMELVEEEDLDGKKRKVKRQVHHGALFSLDEGQVLAELGARKGATIMPILRTAWSGGDPGQANASIETRRSLRAGSYAVGLISLWQDLAAAALLDDWAGGTPQRFVWLDTVDVDAPDQLPEWPGELDWEPPPKYTIRTSLDVASTIVEEVTALRRASLRGQAVASPLDGHRSLNRLKLAGVLAVLDHRRDIRCDDWQLAGVILDASDTARDRILTERRRTAAESELAGHRRAATRAQVVQQVTYERTLQRAAQAVAKRVWRSEGEPVQRRDLTQAMRGDVRREVSVDEAIEEAERLLWIVEKQGTWVPGKARPA